MQIKAITFDYFGTLVDVDRGGIRGMQAVLDATGIDTPRTAAELYLDWDVINVQTYRGGKFRRYREVSTIALAHCLERLEPGVTRRVDIDQLADMLLGHLVEDSPPHTDAVAALEWMSKTYPLMPITNMDSDLWQRSALVDYFEHVTTAEMARAYKPSEAIFKLAIDRLAVAPENILHCSLASWADIDGAKPLGMNVAWINRGGESLGPWQPRPDFEFPTLAGVQAVLSPS
ncbi:hydrolase [Rhodoferax koreense]|uniref:Hydrolase n=1 Tax=Rhodoferax koreensis TaxID=1842727 RepID=A0A1P8JU79_9BURK|nr:HAD family hydrolase [Rhodoferax koreense]APW37314.1 hydrolase [Rhodoferax koreense]